MADFYKWSSLVNDKLNEEKRMTVDRMTAVMPHHQGIARSRFMITDILAGSRSPPSPSSLGEVPKDLSVHCRESNTPLSDGHESGTDSGLPGETNSVCSNGKLLDITQLVFDIIGYNRIQILKEF